MTVAVVARHRAKVYALLAFSIFIVSSCEAPAAMGGSFEVTMSDEVIDALSARFIPKTRDGIGKAVEGRFLTDGNRVVVLDRFSPHLRLFTVAGDPLWAGGPEGGGPRELDEPQAIAAQGRKVIILQHGRISEWRLESDSLIFSASMPIPAEYFPMGVEFGCDGELLIYARNDRQFSAPPDSFESVPRVQYLHHASRTDSGFQLKPLWEADRDINDLAVLGHNAAMISRVDSTVMVLHRSNYLKPGEVIEFSCAGRSLKEMPEIDLVRGSESIPVLVPRNSGLQWTAGIASLTDGFVIAIHKYFSRFAHNVPESYWTTEVFRFGQGGFAGSTLLQGQWSILDYHPERGVLMTADEPVPHFVVVPLAVREPEMPGMLD